jgi:hypothetical protein
MSKRRFIRFDWVLAAETDQQRQSALKYLVRGLGTKWHGSFATREQKIAGLLDYALILRFVKG